MEIFLEEIPKYKPSPVFNKDGTERHVHCDGARFHVLSWSGRIDKYGKIHGFEHCSEPNCEINKETKLRIKELGC